MIVRDAPASGTPAANEFTIEDVAAILRDRAWLSGGTAAPGCVPNMFDAWLAGAAALLGPHAADATALADLLSLIFHYDARATLQRPSSHDVLARAGAREVLRELAIRILDGPLLDSDRFKEIVEGLKQQASHIRGRELFHPIRLALSGRAGDGELDRIILLLDPAAALPFAVPVKSNRVRILEFCSEID
jgi:nondiscriminating glutamyl-tRNA synthetase